MFLKKRTTLNLTSDDREVKIEVKNTKFSLNTLSKNWYARTFELRGPWKSKKEVKITNIKFLRPNC